MNTIVITALYKFVKLPNFATLQAPLRSIMLESGIKGTLLLAAEGINGTIAGSQDSTLRVLEWLTLHLDINSVNYKQSFANSQPFYRTKVKLKKEIVTLGVEHLDPQSSAGTYVEPNQWNDLIEDPEVLLIDTRNDYEINVGTFKNAINPHTNSFREFPDYVKKHLDPDKHKKVAMFCTGGIRCEKSTAYLKEQGFNEVYHLQGGILNYLEKIPKDASTWEGECFVFDNRVTVNHNLEQGQYDQCHACRLPITEVDKQSSQYIQGISCPSCFEQLSDTQLKRFAERQKQMQLASDRGEHHLGSEVCAEAKQRKLNKNNHRQLQRENQRK